MENRLILSPSKKKLFVDTRLNQNSDDKEAQWQRSVEAVKIV